MGSRRGSGEGSVFKRNDRNLWQSTITVGYTDKGRRIRKSVFGKTKAECLKKKRELEADVATGAVPLSGDLRVEEFLTRWIRETCEEKLKASTVSSYRGIVRNHITPVIGRVKLAELKAKHMALVLSEMIEKNKSGSTRKHAYTILNASLKWAVRLDLLPKNPADKIDPPKPASTEQDVYTPDEIKTLLAAAVGDRLEAVIVLSVCTGARQGEIFGMKWSDLDFDKARWSIRRKVIELNGKLLVEDPKTVKSKRQIVLPEMAIDALREHQKRMLKEGFAGVEWAFPSNSGEPLRRQSFNRWTWQPLVKKAKLRKIPFKNLRHAHATVLLASGEHPKIVQERLGHSKIGTTLDIYSHVLPTLQAEAAKKIDDVLGAG